MQALARLGGQRCKMLEAYGRIDQVAQDQPCRLGLPVEEQRGRFVQQSLRKRRIALDPFDYRVLEITSQCHGLHLFLWPLPALRARAFLRTLYSANRAFARSMSRCCPRLVPPPNSTISFSPSFAR